MTTSRINLVKVSDDVNNVYAKNNICHYCGIKFNPGDVIYYTPDKKAGCAFCIKIVTAE